MAALDGGRLNVGTGCSSSNGSVGYLASGIGTVVVLAHGTTAASNSHAGIRAEDGATTFVGRDCKVTGPGEMAYHAAGKGSKVQLGQKCSASGTEIAMKARAS